jgi:hypothetical protein
MPAFLNIEQQINNNTVRRYGHSPNVRYTLREAFTKRPGLVADLSPGTVNTAAIQAIAVANADFVVSGTNAATSLSVLEAGGGVQITTGTTNGDQMIVFPVGQINGVDASAWRKTEWRPNRASTFRTWIVPGVTTNVRIHAGFKLTANTSETSSANACFFRYDTGATAGDVGGWVGVVRTGGNTFYTRRLGGAIVSNRAYELRIEMSDTGAATFSVLAINADSAGTSGVQTADEDTIGAQLSGTAALAPVIALQTLSANARSLLLRGLECSCKLDVV